MGNGLVQGNFRNKGYQKYSIMTFDSYDIFNSFVEQIRNTFPSNVLFSAELFFRNEINSRLANLSNTFLIQSNPYGLFGKQPKTFEEALSRDKFIYWDEYKKIKNEVIEIIKDKLSLTSEFEVMKPEFVYNDRELGEFIYERAAMGLEPQLYYYSFIHKREIDTNKEPITLKKESGKDIWILNSDKTEIYLSFKVEREDGKFEYIKAEGDESIKEASSKGIVDVSSSNKKVYLYKEKKPRIYNAVKLFVGLTAGGYSGWINDFYTGIATVITVEMLESLGYAVEVEVAVGGGRCGACPLKLNFNGFYSHGRRFFTFTAKKFDDLLDLDNLLYVVADPSFHNIKYMQNLNALLHLYGDEMNTNISPEYVWHGIESYPNGSDLINPIGSYHRFLDNQKSKGSNIVYYYFHRVKEGEVVKAVMDMILTAENINIEVLKKSETYGIE